MRHAVGLLALLVLSGCMSSSPQGQPAPAVEAPVWNPPPSPPPDLSLQAFDLGGTDWAKSDLVGIASVQGNLPTNGTLRWSLHSPTEVVSKVADGLQQSFSDVAFGPVWIAVEALDAEKHPVAFEVLPLRRVRMINSTDFDACLPISAQGLGCPNLAHQAPPGTNEVFGWAHAVEHRNEYNGDVPVFRDGQRIGLLEPQSWAAYHNKWAGFFPVEADSWNRTFEVEWRPDDAVQGHVYYALAFSADACLHAPPASIQAIGVVDCGPF